MSASSLSQAPASDCRLCPRLAAFRAQNREREPSWFNAPVPSFGDTSARLLIVGLAPGMSGANRTGRPFTGDFAGDLLYATLEKFAFTEGRYAKRADDGLALRDCRITNAVRCVPPANKPVGAEMRNCRQFLAADIAGLPNLVCIVALGRLAHDNLLSALGEKRSAYPFGHAAVHALENLPTLIDSYHCSRYNTNTRVLTVEMFEAVFALARRVLNEAADTRLSNPKFD